MTTNRGFYASASAVRRVVQAVANMRAMQGSEPDPKRCLPSSGYAEEQPSPLAIQQFERANGDAPALGAD
jgi:hypothetical protein